VGSNYYLKHEDHIYTSSGCSSFDWELITQNYVASAIPYINPFGEPFLSNYRGNFFSKWNKSTQTWDTIHPNIVNPLVVGIDESFQGNGFVRTPNKQFRRDLSINDWEEVNPEEEQFISQVQYSPSGNLYVNLGNRILYSEDNGSSFSEITYPNNPIGGSNYLTILTDSLIVAIPQAPAFVLYSFDNGISWQQIPTQGLTEILDSKPIVKRVNDQLVIVFPGDNMIQIIHLLTMESQVVPIDGYTLFTEEGHITILEDGTIYFNGSNNIGWFEFGLFRIHSDFQTIEYLGEYTEFFDAYLFSLEDEVFAFNDHSYFKVLQDQIVEFSYSGLPDSTVTKSFSISRNNYVYCKTIDNRLYRSTEPLTYPNVLTGSIFQDQDCIENSTGIELKYWEVLVEGDQFSKTTLTNFSGAYRLSVPKGNYQVSAQALNSNWEVCQPTFSIDVDQLGTIQTQHFTARGLSDCSDLTLDFSTPFLRRCFNNYYAIKISNSGPSPTTGTSLTLHLDPFFQFSDASIPYNQINDTTLIIDLGILEVSDELTFYIYFNLSCDAEFGMEHCLSGELVDSKICSNNNRSSYTECQTNIGSYDPNDKRMFNQSGHQIENIDKDEYIYYHIRFQNTGTDTAFTVRVVDQLSSKLDLSTFEMLSSGHLPVYEITDGRTLVVLYEDILLPDSTTNDPLSHGYFKFRIKPLPQYDYGTLIENKAAIYFDFNSPIITNIAKLTIAPPSSSETSQELFVELYPNPTRDQVFIQLSGPLADQVNQVELIDGLGKQVLIQAYTASNPTLSVSSIPTGVYFIRLLGDQEVLGVERLVKIR